MLAGFVEKSTTLPLDHTGSLKRRESINKPCGVMEERSLAMRKVSGSVPCQVYKIFFTYSVVHVHMLCVAVCF